MMVLKFSVVFLTLAVIVVLVDASQTKTNVRYPVKRLRIPRQSRCPDGEYEHEGRVCCRCGAGYKVVSHCKNDPNDGKCEACESGTFSRLPNNRMECDLCRSCDEVNANLEVAEACNSIQDNKCRCKKDHYCSSGTDICRLCQPCQQCGAEGIKVLCTSRNNTICNDKTNGSNSGAIAGTIISILVILIAVVIGVWYLKKRKSDERPQPPSGNNEPATDNQELPLLHDIEPCIPDIAEVLGWTDMQEMAMRSGIEPTNIEACRHDYPGDSRQATLKLLIMWVEKNGSDSSERLLKELKDTGKRNKEEKVRSILSAPQPQ